MYNNPYFISSFNPSMMSSSMMGPNLVRGAATNGLLNGTRGITANTLANGARGAGLLSRLGTGLSSIKSINWGGLINNTSKTLGIINQTIPLVKQVGPMVNNMRSMLKIASIFKDETDTKKTTHSTPNTSINTTNDKKITTNSTTTQNQQSYIYKKEDYTEAPTFFINT